MILTQETIDKITQEYTTWEESQYAGKSKKERQELGAFFTPPALSIKMLEKFDDLSGNFLDPTVGCGGLIAAAVIAGADPRKCYGIELDPAIAALCRERLSKLGVPRCNIKVGNALEEESYNFSDEYEDKPLMYFKIEDLGLSQVKILIELNNKGNVIKKEMTIDYSSNEDKIKGLFAKIYTLFETALTKDYYFCSEKFEGRLKFLNAFFKKYLKRQITIEDSRKIEIV